MGPCRPPLSQGQETCGNGCDENRDGELNEGCAGSDTFDYCERKTGGGYTRWTCGCENGLNVGYCLGSNDSQSSCSSPNGCLKAPLFGSSGNTRIGRRLPVLCVEQALQFGGI